MPKKGNKLKRLKVKQQIKAVSPTLQDQTGFISGVNKGRFEAVLSDGSRVRNILADGLLTQASLGINDSIYVVIRDGTPLVDGVREPMPDYTGEESLVTLSD